jgi:recombination protein RecT
MGQIEQAARNAAEPAPASNPPTQRQLIQTALRTYAPVITKLLAGTGVSEETFTAQVANALRSVPELWECSTETVLGSALRCAQLGMAPNDGTNRAWILPYKGQATFQLGYGGVMELARRAVPGLRFDGRPVYPNDQFDLDYGKAEPLTHRPAMALGLPRGGDAIAWYVRATYPDGTVQVHALDRDAVEYHRSFSKQPNGQMWTKSYDAAALKSTVTDMRRWLPSSAQLAAGLASDGVAYDVRQPERIEDATYDRADVEIDEATGEITAGASAG